MMFFKKYDESQHDFKPMISTLMRLGNETYHVMNRIHTIDTAYKLQFQPRIVDSHLKFEHHYYEEYKKRRDLENVKEVLFIFSLKFIRNTDYLYFKDPPGENILDPMKELVYYTHYLLDQNKK